MGKSSKDKGQAATKSNNLAKKAKLDEAKKAKLDEAKRKAERLVARAAHTDSDDDSGDDDATTKRARTSRHLPHVRLWRDSVTTFIDDPLVCM